jgi:hypothetical protein
VPGHPDNPTDQPAPTPPAVVPPDVPAAGSVGPASPVTILDMVWPETGFPVTVRVDRRPRDLISEADEVQLEVDFVTLRLSPLEFIQLAASLRMSVDTLLDQHPGLQRAVIAAFDLRGDDHPARR